ncbi:MAG TPA: hypothetical protein VGJ20_21045 [Xanthobacteraceae bacterium]|jgi:hypothetical protein
MVTRFSKDGFPYGTPPYTKAEEAEFYRRVNAGPMTVYWGSKPGLPAPPVDHSDKSDEEQS